MNLKRILAAATAALMAAALVACSDDSDTPQENGEPADEKVIDMPDQPGSVEGYEGAAEDAELQTCESDGQALHVGGTVNNPVSETQDYRIYVSAMDGAETMGIVQVDVPGVPAGESADWGTELALSSNTLECVLRVERFPSE